MRHRREQCLRKRQGRESGFAPGQPDSRFPVGHMGIALLAIFLGACQNHLSAADTYAQTVTVQLIDDRFIPDKLGFRHGLRYHLHLENNGTSMHEFTAPEFFKAIDVLNGDVLEPEGNGMVLQPGQRKDLYFVPRRPGHFGLTCADHDWDGMVGEINVE